MADNGVQEFDSSRGSAHMLGKSSSCGKFNLIRSSEKLRFLNRIKVLKQCLKPWITHSVSFYKKIVTFKLKK